jgi:hypothetical protein
MLVDDERPTHRAGLASAISAAPGRRAPRGGDQAEMQHGMCYLDSPLGLRVREQLGRAGGVRPVVCMERRGATESGSSRAPCARGAGCVLSSSVEAWECVFW